MKSRVTTSLSCLLLLVPLLWLAGCNTGNDAGEVEFRVPVSTRDVGVGDVEDRIVATGTLRAAEVVSLTVETGGILRIATDQSGRRLGEGDRVTAGQTVAVITGEDVRLAARTEATHQRYRAAQSDHEAAKDLFDKGLRTEVELRAAETTLEDAKLEYDRSRHTESRNRLVTPIDGMILSLARDASGQPMASGQLVTPGMVIAQVAPTGELIGDIDLVGPDVARVAVGQPSRIRHHAWENESFSGELIRLAPTIDPVTRALRAEIEIPNPDGRLRPGMFVEVTIVAERREAVPVVPRDAVVERGGKRVVFVLRSSTVSQREVVLGLGDDEVVEVREGVVAGEKVVVRGLQTLADGARVRVSGS
jgi:membrane fusion protein (multidrug efflux system)